MKRIFTIPFLLFGLFLTLSQTSGVTTGSTRPAAQAAEDRAASSDSSGIGEIVYREGQGFVALDPRGRPLFRVFPFDNGPDYPSEGLFRIIEDGKIGFADEQGRVVILPRFDAALPFSDSLAAFCEGCSEKAVGEHKMWSGGKWGFIDRRGAVVIPARYRRIIRPFEHGTARVLEDGAEIFINKTGQPVEMNEMNNRHRTEGKRR